MKSQRKFFIKMLSVIFCFLLIITSVLFFIKDPIFEFIKDDSDSLPYRLYFAYLQKFKIEKNDYVLFKHKEYHFSLIKKIEGVSGDRITSKDGDIYINNKFIAKALKRSPFFEKIMKSVQDGEIPLGYIFVCGTHEHSYDSRYEDFGLIPLKNVKALLWPIF